ncbi:MAG: RNA-binding cell elongation regulator Jag/EloR [Chloroflexota bacterium]|nr:RNA-binding cell elongation regulator Jag/EloR [Chloroflexota bacterium]
MESLEKSAKTVEEAVELALEELSVSRDEVEIVVLKEGRSGFLGIGGVGATVRVTRRQPDEVADEAAGVAKETLERLLALMGIEATVEEKEPSPGGLALFNLEIKGDDLGILIGRRGQTLSSLQYLLYLMVGHRLKGHVPLSVDVECYLERRQESLQGLARRMAERVMDTGQIVIMEPMPARERRVIHLELREYDRVMTQSVGEGEGRKVTIIPRRGPRR